MGTKDPRIDAYIDHAAPFAQPVLRHLRKVVHTASPDIGETMKWGVPDFMQKGILCSMAAFKQHCAFSFWKENVVPRDAGTPVAKAMVQFGRITSIADLPPPAVLIGYVREAIRLNEPGGRTSWIAAGKPRHWTYMPARKD